MSFFKLNVLYIFFVRLEFSLLLYCLAFVVSCQSQVAGKDISVMTI